LIVPALLAKSILPGWPGLLVFGLALAFHIHSSFRETHREQSDLKTLGWGASALILSAGHVIFGLMTVGFLLGHQRGMAQAWHQAWNALAAALSYTVR
jgi:hypothetical protein